MELDALLDQLRRMEPELKRSGLRSLYLFGSRARGDNRPDSDVDLAFEVANDAHLTFSLLDHARLQLDLADALGTDVDFVERGSLRPRIREQV